MNILGIDIDESSRGEIHARVEGFLCKDSFHRIATVNPEFLVEADRNPVFRDALRAADLRVADGFGIVLAGLLLGRRIVRYPGTDLMMHILEKAEREGLGIFLAIRKDGLSSYGEIRSALLKRYPNILIDGADVDISSDASCIIRHASSVLFCNFGAPEQELFLESLRSNPGSIRLAMGVGGAFDFLTGKRKRAPKWMRALGLEWLWRLLLQPTRIGRIRTATAVFLWRVFLEKKKTTH